MMDETKRLGANVALHNAKQAVSLLDAAFLMDGITAVSEASFNAVLDAALERVTIAKNALKAAGAKVPKSK